MERWSSRERQCNQWSMVSRAPVMLAERPGADVRPGEATRRCRRSRSIGRAGRRTGSPVSGRTSTSSSRKGRATALVKGVGSNHEKSRRQAHHRVGAHHVVHGSYPRSGEHSVDRGSRARPADPHRLRRGRDARSDREHVSRTVTPTERGIRVRRMLSGETRCGRSQGRDQGDKPHGAVTSEVRLDVG